MARYLINKTSALGDIAQSLAVAQYLKERNSACKIDWIVESPGISLVERHPNVDRAIGIDWRSWRKSLWKLSTLKNLNTAIYALRAHRYEAIFDLQGNFKSGIINCLAHAKTKVGFHKKCLREKINALSTDVQFQCESLPMPSRYLELVKAFFKDTSQFVVQPVFLSLKTQEKDRVDSIVRPIQIQRPQECAHFLICPFSAWPSKRLGSDQLDILIDHLNYRFKATLWLASGSPQEQMIAKGICERKNWVCRLLPQLSIPQLQYFMRLCSAVFAMDSLPLHLAQSAQISTFGFFGPSHYKAYSPDQGPSYRYEKPVEGHFQGICPYNQNFKLRCCHMRTCFGPCLKTQTSENFLPALAEFTERLGYRMFNQ